jgi:hypothetical protein
MNEDRKTKLTLEIGSNKFSWESAYEDCSVTDILEALHGLLVGQTFMSETVIQGMKEYVEEHDYELS